MHFVKNHLVTSCTWCQVVKNHSLKRITNHADAQIIISNLSLSVVTLFLLNWFAHVPLLLKIFLLAGLVFALFTFKQGVLQMFLKFLLKSELFPLLDSYRWHFSDLFLLKRASCSSPKLLTDSLGKEYVVKFPALEFRRTTSLSLDL